MGTIKIEVRKSVEIEVEIPAYFVDSTDPYRILRLSDGGVVTDLRAQNKEVSIDAHMSISYCADKYLLIDPDEGKKKWNILLTRAKENFDALSANTD